MFFGLKWYVLAGILLSGMGLMGGSFYMGVRHERANNERDGWRLFAKKVDNVLALADTFSKLGSDLAKELARIDGETKTVIRYQTRYVHEKPLDPVCKLDPRVVELRSCQIDKIWRAAGRELPRDRQGTGTCPALPDK